MIMNAFVICCYCYKQGDLSSDKAVRILGEATDPARVLVEMTGSVRWTAPKGLVVGVSLRRPRPCPDKGPLIRVDSGGNLQVGRFGFGLRLFGGRGV